MKISDLHIGKDDLGNITVITRGRGRPKRPVVKKIKLELQNPKIMVIHGQTYVHGSRDGEKVSFGPGTKVAL